MSSLVYTLEFKQHLLKTLSVSQIEIQGLVFFIEHSQSLRNKNM